jgi:23S rRNA (cytidine2498-2'-O)-methyltransferase
MHVFLSAEASEQFLLEELRRGFPGIRHEIRSPGLIDSDLTLQREAPLVLVFARQILSEAQEYETPSVSAWSERLLHAAVPRLPEKQPWLLHIQPHYGSGVAGQHRCRLIRQSFCELLQRKRRHLLRTLQEEPGTFTASHSLAQLILTAPDRGLISVAPRPEPFCYRGVMSPFPKGEIPVASDKAAPSRAFAKLIEAELRLGRRIERGQTCVDLGASPGSWSYVALRRGARVIAVDRAPLRADLMRHPRLEFHQGDAFSFQPREPVDWLLCDVIAAPQRTIELILDWIRHGRACCFVVTIKFKGCGDYPILEQLKYALPAWCEDFFLMRLCTNKNEVCAFGVISARGAGGRVRHAIAETNI